ncbi:MAG: hypothetical protein RBU23_12625 [Candidatus Auribacterota bacterium]|jgi:hypothetical protein|nr:hypothetical protein [Candidatus Auribacterota bacterium]
MKNVIGKFLIKLVLPIIGLLFEEAMKLILEAVGDDSMDSKQKVRYVVQGVTDKIGAIDQII